MMINLLYILIISFFTVQNIFSQNLIPNADFELGPNKSSVGWQLDCNNEDTVLGPDLWTLVSGSPDRLVFGTICYGFDDIPAKSGLAFITIGVWNATITEAGKATLLIPLEKDSLYSLCYYIRKVINCPADSPQIVFSFNNSGSIIKSPIINNSTWLYIDTFFVSETYSTEITIKGTGQPLSCANIDSISLTKVTSTFIPAIRNEETNNFNVKIINQFITIERFFYGKCLIQIYSTTGRLIHNIETNDSPRIIDFSTKSDGLYFIVLKTKNSVQVKKIFYSNNN